MARYEEIAIDLIDPPPHPVRAQMDDHALEELAADIRQNGVIEPLIVSPADGRYRIWAGHRRYIASKLAYLRALPCIVREESELPSEAVMISENLCREELTPSEVGWFVLELVEKYHLTMDELCRRLRRSEAWIQDRVDLVRLDSDVAKAVAAKQISFTVAKVLLQVPDDEHRKYLLKTAIDHGCNVRTMQYMVQQWKQDQQMPKRVTDAGNVVMPSSNIPDTAPRCVLCKLQDNPANLKTILVHYYHWDPVKRFLRDNGIEVLD